MKNFSRLFDIFELPIVVFITGALFLMVPNFFAFKPWGVLLIGSMGFVCIREIIRTRSIHFWLPKKGED